MTHDLGPCFQPPPPAPPGGCLHPPEWRYAWHARDDTAPGGQLLCVVCMACGAELGEGGKGTGKRKRRSKKAEAT